MARNMSFALTTNKIKDKSKTVTRRFGWYFLKVGDVLNAVEKSMGLKKGEKIKKLALIRVTNVRAEQLNKITKADCVKEGFPNYEPEDFIEMLQDHYNGIKPDAEINRIEFEYI